MKLTINTNKLQEMVTRSVKGAGNNKLIPLTGLMSINLTDNILTLTTTDATNYLYIREDKVAGDDFYITVPVDTFSKLIARMTCETIILELEENALKVTGNGTYSIELPLDEEGSLIKYPDPYSTFEVTSEEDDINLTTIQAILTTVKPALATTLEVPCYTGYYIGDRVVGTDTYKIAGMNIKLFQEPKLISADMMNLLSVMTAEKIHVSVKNNNIVFITPDCILYGTVMEGIEDYAIDAISSLLDSEFESMCRLSKTAILQLLDRLALFVNAYDNNGIYLTFTKDGVMVSSKASSGVELVPYIESKNFLDYTCCIDIAMLVSQIKAQIGDVVELYYGDNTAIKMVDGNCTQIIALLEDDRQV